MTVERAEEDRAVGLLRFTLGGTRVELPALKIRQAREWKKRLSAVSFDDETVDVMEYPVDTMLDLVEAYDVQGILGGRESIEDRATDLELYTLFRQILEATFPFVTSPVLTSDFGRLVVAGFFARASSMNGPLPSGASTPTPSRNGSRRSSSSSSGKRARSG